MSVYIFVFLVPSELSILCPLSTGCSAVSYECLGSLYIIGDSLFLQYICSFFPLVFICFAYDVLCSAENLDFLELKYFKAF